MLLEFTDGDGTTHRFVREGAPCSRWAAPPGVSLRIREEFDAAGLPTAYELVRPDGVVYRAEQRRCAGDSTLTASWQVVSVRDRRGNALGYCYTPFGPLGVLRLTTVTHNRYPAAPVARLDYTPAGDLARSCRCRGTPPQTGPRAPAAPGSGG